ncbi:MAG: amino acid adenylation domain-containing protein [Chitinispirillales bacterium]|jgi:amino acid adenylation domain-containing protein|nr:amino acid adenylation domain-containing protein [Chitinispirillales bacterium]
MHNLIEFLENTRKENGSKTAAEAADGILSFSELRLSALQISGAIYGMRGAYCEKKMIAVYLPKSVKCLCAMLGVLYSGNTYVPMDCRAPANRTKLILELTTPSCVITDIQGKRVLVDIGFQENKIILCDEITLSQAVMSNESVENVIRKTQDIDPAYMLFTSGSTGVPKGVLIPHRRVINYINWARDFFEIESNEVIGSQAPFYFTVSAMDIYLSLATGSKLFIIPENLFSRPKLLMQCLNEQNITLIFWVSSVYHHAAKADALDGISLPSLKHAWFVGEPMASASLGYWMKKLPAISFANLYGSTETDMTVCYPIAKAPEPHDMIALGLPCANVDILLIKDDKTAAQPGETGEICIRGTCLALGYYKNPEKTNASFIENPLNAEYPEVIYKTGDLGEMRDGLLYFHGRRDHQFKHLGYRIEAGEIEAAAQRFSGIKNVCVLYDEKKQQIALFYETSQEINEIEYRRALAADLPIYMLPAKLIRLETMPFNANSKKDRMLLKKQYMKEA